MNPVSPPSNGMFISIEEAKIKRQRYINQLGNPDDPNPNPNPTLELFRYRMMRVNADLVRQLLQFEKEGKPVTNIRLYPGLNTVDENGVQTDKFTLILCAESADGTLVKAADLSEDLRIALQLTEADDVIEELRPCPPPPCPEDIV